MSFLVLCKLLLLGMRWYICVVDAQSGDQSWKNEEYQMGPKQCEERCLDTGDCWGFRYDSSALRCRLAYEEDNFQYRSTARKCGTSWCKRGERCLKTRRSRYVCVSYLTQEEHLPDKEVKLDLKDMGFIETGSNFFACDVTRVYEPKKRDYVFLLSLNELLAIDLKTLKRSYTWPIVYRRKLKVSGLMSSYMETSHVRNKSFLFIIISSTNNKNMCLLSINDRKLFNMRNIDLSSIAHVKFMMTNNRIPQFVNKRYHLSRRPGRHHELSIAKLEMLDKVNNALKKFSSINTGLVNVIDNPMVFFVYDNYLFVLVQNILLRWKIENTGNIEIRTDSMRTYRWDSPRNAVCLSVYQGQTLYIVDRDAHLRKTEMHLLLKQLNDLDN